MRYHVPHYILNTTPNYTTYVLFYAKILRRFGY